MHAGDGDTVLEAHELGEHLGAGDDGRFASAGFEDLGVVGGDGGAGDDDVTSRGVGGGMAEIHGSAQVLEALSDGGGAEVGAGDRVAHGEQDFGDAAHTDAADTDKVNQLGRGEHGVLRRGHSFIIVPPAPVVTLTPCAGCAVAAPA